MLLLTCFACLFYFISTANSCGYPGSPAHAFITFSTEVVGPGTVATYKCDRGFEILGPARRVCAENGTWLPQGMPFCVLNVATGKAPMQSTIAQGGFPQKAIDGSTSNTPNPETCTMTEIEAKPWWYVNLLESYSIQLVRVDFGRPCCAGNVPATVVVRVGNNRPDNGNNPVCNRYIGPIELGRPLYLACSRPMLGAFVSIHWEGPPGSPLSICEAFVYTDQAVPVESCPSFRDQPLGSTATFNGKCYIFYNNQPANFMGASRTCEARGGSLVDETSPILQGFLSWELWQRHRNEPSGQYWMGATRDPANSNNWKWLNGNDMTVSFWNLPGGNENCSRFDGTKGWLWSDTNCNLNLNFICQHRPLTCGHPEQPPNSTLAVTSRDFIPTTAIRYICSPGDLLIGPERRTCQANGYYNEYPPTCKHLECGLPAEIPNGRYILANETKFYTSMVRYFCDDGFALTGRGDLVCDVDEKWDGPPPRCEPATCQPPLPIPNGYFASTTNVTMIGTVITYFCSEANYALVGQQKIVCTQSGQWSDDPPICQKSTQPGGGQGGQGSPALAPPTTAATPLLANGPPADRDDTSTEHTEHPPLLPGLFDWLQPSRDTPQNLPENIGMSTTARPNQPVVESNGFRPMDVNRPPPQFKPDFLQPEPENDSSSTSAEDSGRQSFEITDPPEEVVHTGPSHDSSVTQEFTLPPTTTSTTSTTTTTTTTTTPAPPPPPTTTTTTSTTTTTTPPPTTTTTTTTTQRPTTTTKPWLKTTTFILRTFKPTGVTLHPNLITSRNNILPTQRENNVINVQQVTTTYSPEGDRHTNGEISTAAAGRLNTGGIIALSVFGGFVILAAVVTILVIVYRRKQPRGSMDNITVSTYDSGSEHGGLTKYYKRAWENLRTDKGVAMNPHQHPRSKGLEHNYQNQHRGGTFEGMRDSNEMTVSDSAAWSTRKDVPKSKSRNHNHHHHHHRHRDDDEDLGPWYNRHR